MDDEGRIVEAGAVARSPGAAARSQSDLAPGKEERLFSRVEQLLKGDAAVEPVSIDERETLLLMKAVKKAQGYLAAAARMLGVTRPRIV
ncbi:hypothetical protein K9U39_14165 [Rhodoblastus acidophilus]|uniref:DNA binding HTH domain-containing protein n=1 Tax=Candidatus Rhodoblastus alkanivorans TaxID=2954117 RepID=A0ABS9ZCY1_9HYPH|nr:helix-turn-helix domain-containing protein [Candidatus Rhodoblastus alkanivorans]MCI4677751.1 hypothetical protein [Candidatus Rhodoblastus alkanivorans]MCI4684751.1 hypothetical protein [Candidatus Rhodoblastus alkanivorans]MDI4642074.1 hypothetical protein [Rhodoblastus acidophilus]